MTNFKTILLRINVGRIKVNMSAFLTAIGAMAIPLAIVFVIEIPGAYSFSSIWSWIALALFVFGALVIYRAWKITKEEEKQRQEEQKQRLRESVYLISIIAEIANKMGIDMQETIVTLERKLKDGK